MAHRQAVPDVLLFFYSQLLSFNDKSQLYFLFFPLQLTRLKIGEGLKSSNET